jgi:adenylyltransferase/sulfurtransferase
MTIWTDERLAEITSWVEAAYPEEGCGLILRRASGEVEVLKCENLANKYHALDPQTYPRTAETFYIINPAEFIRAERRGDEVLVIFHSHADVGDYFSDEDVAGATMPRVDGDDGPEPSHPGVDYLVVSVREGAADHATLFTFDAQAPRAWRAELELELGGGGVEVREA